MKYRYIQEHLNQYPLALMCRALLVSPQGYYQWHRRKAWRELARKKRRLLDSIHLAHAKSRRTYGRRRVTRELSAQAAPVNQKYVGHLMRSAGLRAKAAIKFKTTTDLAHKLPIAENVLAREFTATAPNQKWVGESGLPRDGSILQW